MDSPRFGWSDFFLGEDDDFSLVGTKMATFTKQPIGKPDEMMEYDVISPTHPANSIYQQSAAHYTLTLWARIYGIPSWAHIPSQNTFEYIDDFPNFPWKVGYVIDSFRGVFPSLGTWTIEPFRGFQWPSGFFDISTEAVLRFWLADCIMRGGIDDPNNMTEANICRIRFAWSLGRCFFFCQRNFPLWILSQLGIEVYWHI